MAAAPPSAQRPQGRGRPGASGGRRQLRRRRRGLLRACDDRAGTCGRVALQRSAAHRAGEPAHDEHVRFDGQDPFRPQPRARCRVSLARRRRWQPGRLECTRRADARRPLVVDAGGIVHLACTDPAPVRSGHDVGRPAVLGHQPGLDFRRIGRHPECRCRVCLRHLDDRAQRVCHLRRSVRELRLHRKGPVQPAFAGQPAAEPRDAHDDERIAAIRGAGRRGVRTEYRIERMATAAAHVRAAHRHPVHAGAHRHVPVGRRARSDRRTP